MRLTPLLPLLLLFAACSGHRSPRPGTLSVGQPWDHARQAARAAGYTLHDAADLQMAPAPVGFFLELPGNRAILVYRDSPANAVRALELWENWSGPKSARSHHPLTAFDLPAAAAGESRIQGNRN